MVVRSTHHRALRRLLVNDDDRYLDPGLADRARRILTVLILVEDMDEFVSSAPPGWRAHKLSGKRRKEWSVSVSGNWRMTFKEENGHIDGLDLEDYH